MNINPDNSPRAPGTPRKPLRLWPGVVAVALQWLAWLVVPAVVPEWAAIGIVGAAVFGLAVVVWWLFFSRAPWSERLGAIVLMVAAVAATSRLVHESDFERDDGVHAVRLRHPGPQPRPGRVGRGQPRLLQRISACIDGRRDRARMRHVDPHPDQRHDRRR